MEMAHFVLLSIRAEKDLRDINPAARSRVEDAVKTLADDGDYPLDSAGLTDRRPWRRIRVGDWRILYRPVASEELGEYPNVDTDGYLVARVVNRRDLRKALRAL